MFVTTGEGCLEAWIFSGATTVAAEYDDDDDNTGADTGVKVI